MAIPAAAAALAYLNAKFAVAADVFVLNGLVALLWVGPRLEKKDRVNVFYVFEDLALSPKSANRLFLLLPPDSELPNQRTQWTYAQSYETVLKYAAWLKEKFDIRRNEIVGMDFTNKPQFLWLWLALWSLGAVPAFMNTNLRGKPFIHCAKLSTSRLMIIDPAIQDVLDEKTLLALASNEKGPIEPFVLDDATEARIHALPPYRAPNDVRKGTLTRDPALLIYTSGTTGLPKAANVGWNKPNAGITLFAKIVGLKPTDRFYTAMPLYHSAASMMCVCQCLGAGCTFVLGSRFSAKTFMKQVAETDSTAMQYIGELCRYLVASAPSPYDKAHKLRVAFGNGMRPDVWQKFKDRFNIDTIVEFYGATEGPGLTVNHSRNSFYRGAIGKTGLLAKFAARKLQVLVRYDPDADKPYRDPKTGFCKRADTNEPGELIMALDPEVIADRFQGYLGNDQATESKVLRDVFAKGDAYFRTGDLLRLDNDYRWWFVDRIGDTFRWKSENVSTAEVSEALGSHPAVQEANVYGVQLPNYDGRCGCAAIILKDGQKTLNPELSRSLAEHIKSTLPRYAVPLFLRLVKELEMTGTVKQTKVQLRNEGVEHSKTGDDELWYLPSLKPGQGYEPFTSRKWSDLSGGHIRL